MKQTSRTHGFIRVLRDGNRLIRCYTQNIDGLETREGLCTDMDRGHGCRTRFSRKSTQLPRSPARYFPGGDLDGGCEVVQLHGNLDVLKCSFCRATCKWDERGREAQFLLGETPTCPSCEGLAQERQDQGKRGTKIGTLRPNIVLYGEEHPSADIIGKLSVHDLGLAPDLLLILGTSLQVHGLKLLVREFAKSVHARGRGKGKVILVNLSKPSESVWKNVIDYWVRMDCDEWVDSVRASRPDFWYTQTELDVQIKKPQLNPKKIKRNRKEGTDKLYGIKCSSAPSQDILLELKRVPSIPKPKATQREVVDRTDEEGVISCKSSTVNALKMEDQENDGVNDQKAKRCPDPSMSSDCGMTSSLPVFKLRLRAPFRTILNESTRPALNVPPAAESAQVGMKPRETGTVSPYFVRNPDTGPGCQQQHTAEQVIQESSVNQQLLTPPPSGRRKASLGDVPYKRRRFEEMDYLNTPVKRFKADLKIWQDEDMGS